jgi:hypothetical protein
MDAIPTISSVFTDTKEEDCRAAAAQVVLGLASQGDMLCFRLAMI